ncbi:MAG: MBL fold metallo-hydrolase [Mycobacteriaceae bacterium]
MGASRALIAKSAASSTHYADGAFHNSEPSQQFTPTADESGILNSLLTRSRVGRPAKPIPLVVPEVPEVAADLAATWYGHSSVLVEIDGFRVLTDPVWGKRCSPSEAVGPARLHPVPVALTELPEVDVVLISHDHYDHLDMRTVQKLAALGKAIFLVPLGIGAHLRIWGISDDRIIELDWNESHQVTCDDKVLTLTCTEARHFSGRGLVRNTTQWASWSLSGPTRRIFFGGDTGYTQRFSEIGEKYGPFDMTLLPVGAYNEQWRDIHMNPEEAVQSHLDLNSSDADNHGVLVPIHWATFNLAFHPWSEPITRLLAAAAEKGVKVSVPKPGQRLDAQQLPVVDQWWVAVS